jgi:chromosome partitioning protein
MRIAAFVSETPSVGKSLIACHLALQAGIAGTSRIAIVELGEGPLVAWRRARASGPDVYRATPENLQAVLTALAGEADVALIDCALPVSSLPPRLLDGIALALVPVAPHRDGLRAVAAVASDLARHAAPVRFIVTRIAGQPKFTAAYARAIAEHAAVSPDVVPENALFERCLTEGASVLDPGIRQPDLARVFEGLWSSLATVLAPVRIEPALSAADEREPAAASDRPAAAPALSPRFAGDNERRAFPRWHLDWDGCLSWAQGSRACRVVNLSGGGAAVRTSLAVTAGAAVTLAVPTVGVFEATAIHRCDEYLGIRFAMEADGARQLADTLARRLQPEEASSPAAVVPAHPAGDACDMTGVGERPAEGACATHLPPPSAPAAGLTREPPRKRHRLLQQVSHVKAVSLRLRDLNRTIAEGDGRRTPGRIIVIGNEKGGSGKSTIAVHLMAALLKEGFDVASVDLDWRQGSFSRYLDHRRAFTAGGTPLLQPTSHRRVNPRPGELEISALLTGLSRQNDYVVIDTPGHDAPLSRLAHLYADVIVTPINDSFLDLDVIAELDPDTQAYVAAGPYGALVAEVRAERGGVSPDWIVVRNRLSTVLARNKAEMADAMERLAQRLNFRVGPGLTERVIYRELFPQGLTLLDLRQEGVGIPLTLSHVAARQEVRSLMQLVLPCATRAPGAAREPQLAAAGRSHREEEAGVAA